MKTSHLLSLLLLVGCSSSVPFDSAMWKSKSIPESARLQMGDDLVNSRLLLNKDRAEVVSLLGEPPKTQYFKEYDLVYYLGPERGFMGIDSEWLIIKLGKDGRVTEARIARD